MREKIPNYVQELMKGKLLKKAPKYLKGFANSRLAWRYFYPEGNGSAKPRI